MDKQHNNKKFPGWAIALIFACSVIYLALAAGLVCGGVIFMAENYSTSHARIGDSSYWIEKSKAMLQDDEALLTQAQETMEQGGITTITMMDPDDGMAWDTILRGKGYTYRVAYSNASNYNEQAYTLLYIMDTLNEKYGIVRIDMENGLTRYEFTRNNDLFRESEDSLCHSTGGANPTNMQTDNISDIYTKMEDGWFYRSYQESIELFD